MVSKAGSHELEMAQKAQALATKPDRLSSIPRTYVVDRPDFQKHVFWPPHEHTLLCVYMQVNKNNF